MTKKKAKQTIVLASGVFDILHLGHIHYLKQAKKLGELLYVVLARDKTVQKKKGKAFNDEKVRMRLVSALRCVDKVFLGDEDLLHHQFEIIKKLKPDLIAIGFDQIYDNQQLEREIFKQTGHKVKVKRLTHYKGKFNKTSQNIQEIYKYHQKKKKNKI